jgi:nucleotide-binding universal stress UspA family protein
MKKILAVFDGYKLCQGTIEYAIEITKLNNAHLTGVFLDAFYYRSYNFTKVIKTAADPDLKIKELDKLDEQQRAKSANDFEQACQQSGISFSIHRDHSMPLYELQYESMFADLIVINESEKFTPSDHHVPTVFIKDLLSSLQSPVLVVPDQYTAINKIVFLYDGEPSSLYAIKMFSYLLESWKDLPVEVITVDEKSLVDAQIPGSVLMVEFMNRIFSNVTFKIYQGVAEEAILSHLKAGENQVVVLGAYRRNRFSRWLKRSMADSLITNLDIPLFIAHH